MNRLYLFHTLPSNFGGVFFMLKLFLSVILEKFISKEGGKLLEEKQNELYIPSNIKTRLEFFKGYGVKEMVITLGVMAFSLPIIFLIYKLKGTLLAVIILFIITSGTVILIIKDDNNLCVSKQIGFMLKNLNMQKKYNYKYFDKRRGIK